MPLDFELSLLYEDFHLKCYILMCDGSFSFPRESESESESFSQSLNPNIKYLQNDINI